MEGRIAYRSDMHPSRSRGGATLARRCLFAGLLLCGGYLFGASMLGGCGGSGPTWPSGGQLPDAMIQRLAECGKKGPIPLESKTYNLSFMVRVSEGENEVEVEEVLLKDSTLQLHEVESCMAEALRTMRAPLQVLALRRRRLLPEGPMSPESRALLGQAEAVLLLEAGGVVVVGLAIYAVVVYILEDKKPRRHHPHPTTAEPTATVEPVATVEPLVPAAPIASMAPTTTAAPTATTIPTTTSTPAKVDCRAVKRKCLDHCSDTALPSGNSGFRFWNCVNLCMTANGC